MPFVLDERGAGEKVELLNVEGGDALLHRFHQGQVLTQRDRYLGLAQFGKKREEHGSALAAASAPHPDPLPASGERERPAPEAWAGEGRRCTSVNRVRA